MASLTQKERELLLLLFKDFTTYYNANSMSNVLNISHVGAQKICKKLLAQDVVISKTIGKSITYKLDLDNDYVNQLIIFLLADEANNFKRWKEEFKEFFKNGRIIMLFGSAVKDYVHAQDIDIMVVMESTELKEVNTLLKKKEGILPKKINAILLTPQDLLENLKKKDKVVIDVVKNAIILYGQERYVGILKHVTSF